MTHPGLELQANIGVLSAFSHALYGEMFRNIGDPSRQAGFSQALRRAVESLVAGGPDDMEPALQVLRMSARSASIQMHRPTARPLPPPVAPRPVAVNAPTPVAVARRRPLWAQPALARLQPAPRAGVTAPVRTAMAPAFGMHADIFVGDKQYTVAARWPEGYGASHLTEWMREKWSSMFSSAMDPMDYQTVISAVSLSEDTCPSYVDQFFSRYKYFSPSSTQSVPDMLDVLVNDTELEFAEDTCAYRAQQFFNPYNFTDHPSHMDWGKAVAPAAACIVGLSLYALYVNLRKYTHTNRTPLTAEQRENVMVDAEIATMLIAATAADKRFNDYFVAALPIQKQTQEFMGSSEALLPVPQLQSLEHLQNKVLAVHAILSIVTVQNDTLIMGKCEDKLEEIRVELEAIKSEQKERHGEQRKRLEQDFNEAIKRITQQSKISSSP